jgi:RNA polymerase sigma-70 factor (ECF subfamily)
MLDWTLCTDVEIESILNKYSNMVYRLALARTKQKSDAEDILQEVFLRLIKSKPVFENEEHEKAWIIRVTINCSSKLLTSAWFRHTSPLQEDLRFETEEKSDVYFAVLELPMKYRTIIHLFYYEDLSIAKMSEVLSLKESTIKSQLLRARKMLKVKLKGDFDYE